MYYYCCMSYLTASHHMRVMHGIRVLILNHVMGYLTHEILKEYDSLATADCGTAVFKKNTLCLHALRHVIREHLRPGVFAPVGLP
jgi:hypothetical protein